MTARILVVDDVPSNARLLEALLAEEYYEVKSIQDSRETLRVANDWQPDVLLLDVMMPGLDGYAVCRLIKGTRATGDGHGAARAAGPAAGAGLRR
jgi:two-component system cell cycle response regulator